MHPHAFVHAGVCVGGGASRSVVWFGVAHGVMQSVEYGAVHSAECGPCLVNSIGCGVWCVVCCVVYHMYSKGVCPN